MKLQFLLLFFVCCASLGAMDNADESFIVQEKPERERRKSANQLKEEIVDLLGLIIEQESKAIEQKARVQKDLCKKIRSVAQSEKNNFLGGKTIRELQELLKKFKKQKLRGEKQIQEDAQLLAILGVK